MYIVKDVQECILLLIYLRIILTLLCLWYATLRWVGRRHRGRRGTRIAMNLWARKASSAPTNIGNTRYSIFRDLAIEALLVELALLSMGFALFLSLPFVVVNDEEWSLLVPTAGVVVRR